jgi:toxin ParE1/3/4
MSFSLSDQALDDMAQIYLEGLRLFGVVQADRYIANLDEVYGMLADHPRMGRENADLRPPVLIFPSGSHIVVYEVAAGDHVRIIRIRHHRENWLNDPVGDTP